ncbi:hypothetical protein [Flavivirga spongiicola]|uniref:HTH luxR-type domain-containing protein n=1 Tax=Flavivirga spongiicola TaxID=421621 RepID=A0ABU7XQT3_9FLAO|nr:hypothetical protein [Flavivirga sp. MEBiC05379]MDO5978128.1 hypothetical protein [Flavivirga sp. MEBiC05379]
MKPTICNSFIFDVLVWSLDIKTNNFRQISSNFDYNAISTCNFKNFLLAIKPCFQSYFVDYFVDYFNVLIENKNKINISDCRFQSFLPVKLKQNKYFFANLCIIPEVQNNKIVELFFVITPLKEYQNEVLNFGILKGRKKDELLTNQINNQVYAENLFTKEQVEIFNLLVLGYSSSRISEILNKKKDNILKYNIRIKDKLASFFNIDFNNVKEAANYYKKCFLTS